MPDLPSACPIILLLLDYHVTSEINGSICAENIRTNFIASISEKTLLVHNSTSDHEAAQTHAQLQVEKADAGRVTTVRLHGPAPSGLVALSDMQIRDK